jgi:hypothetical protein
MTKPLQITAHTQELLDHFSTCQSDKSQSGAFLSSSSHHQLPKIRKPYTVEMGQKLCCSLQTYETVKRSESVFSRHKPFPANEPNK